MSHQEAIKKLREDFMKGTLTESDVSKSPCLQFNDWIKQAVDAQIPEAQAMTLSTVSSNGKPSSRIVYLREYNEDQYWFYTNYNSKKALELTKNNNVCINFFWPELERQIRIEGTVSIADKSLSDAYFKQRPHDSQVGAWSSEQSKVLKSREELEDIVKRNAEKFERSIIPRPEFWGGYVIKANYYEFWQGRKSRLHDRIAYTLENNKWKIERLAP
jgi:pyridoxamine 5'-phosphate oxidase